MEKKQSVCMSEYEYHPNLLYQGHHSCLYKALNHRRSHPPLLFKAYHESCLTDPLREKKLMHELNTLWKLAGKPHIAQIVSQHSRDQKVIIITELYGGTLGEQVRREGKFSEQKSVGYIEQIIQGYRHIYESEIIHRNLQPSNIFCGGLEVVIGDFSDSIKASDIRLSALHEQLVGNIHFQPFEALSEYRYSTQSDIYSIGAILFFMLTGSPPFQGSKAEILAKMKRSDMGETVKCFRSSRIKEFLSKTLCMREQERMRIEELINFRFESMAQLHKFKLYTFDGRTDQVIEDPVKSHLQRNTSFESNTSQKKPPKQPQPNDLFKRFQPSGKKPSLINLKMSDDCEVSKLYRDKEISIFIPTKFDINNSLQLEHQESQLISQPQIECIEPIARRASEAVTKKSILGGSVGKGLGDYGFKSATIKDLVENMKQTRKESTAMHKRQVSSFQETNKQTGKFNTCEIEPNKIAVPPLLFREQKQTNRGSNGQVLGATDRSKGLLTLRGREGVMQFGETLNAVIAGWLVSQIDLSRFINRVLFRIKKASMSELQGLSACLEKWKRRLLDEVRNLSCLSPQHRASFQESIEYEKIREIVAAYEARCSVQAHGEFEGLDRVGKMLAVEINGVYRELLGSTSLGQELIKLLDYLVTLWQLAKLIKKRDLQYFHAKSKIQLILDAQESKPTVAHLLQLYERIKLLKLV